MTDFWVGGYTQHGDDGVRRLHPGSGATEVAARTADPSFLLASPAHAAVRHGATFSDKRHPVAIVERGRGIDPIPTIGLN